MEDIIVEQLKKISLQDADRIRILVTKLGQRHKPLSDEDLQTMIDSSVTTILVVRNPKEKHIVGMVTLAVYRIPYLKKAYLDDLIVDETHRGKGLGSKLIAAAMKLAEEKGAAYLDFTSHPSRTGANLLYEKLGFKKKESNAYRFTYDYEK